MHGMNIKIILQKHEVIKMTEKDENQSVVVTSYNIGLSTVYEIRKQKDQLQMLLISSESGKGLFRLQTLKQAK
jgi:hypothetical protein